MKGKDSVLAVTKRPFKVVAAWLALFMVLSTAVVGGTNYLLLATEAHAADPVTVSATSSNNFTLTVTADPGALPAGGGQVTYTFKVKNNNNQGIYLRTPLDTGMQCEGLTSDTDAGITNSSTDNYGPRIVANGEATWTCTRNVTSESTTTAKIGFARADSYGTSGWSAGVTASVPVTVTVAEPTSPPSGTPSGGSSGEPSSPPTGPTTGGSTTGQPTSPPTGTAAGGSTGNPRGSTSPTATPTSGTGNSGDGDFRLTVSADKYSLPAGGGQVTYTYTVEVLKNKYQYYSYYYSYYNYTYYAGRLTHDGCSNITVSTPTMGTYDGRQYIAPYGKAVWTCTQNVTETTTSTATIGLADGGYGYSGNPWTGRSSASASVTVTVADPTPPDPPGPTDPTPVSTSDDSDDGKFTLTKTASNSTVPHSGGTITYTYTAKNNSDDPQYFVGGSDDKCPNVAYVSGMEQVWNGYAGRYLKYIPAQGTGTWTCEQYLAQATTNTATLTMADSYGESGWAGESTATTSVTVSKETLPGGYTCSDIWYTSDEYWNRTTPFKDGNGNVVDGTLGTINKSTGVAGKQVDIHNHTYSTSYPNFYGSAAVAVDPSDPKYVYYAPRWSTSDTAGLIYRYDITSTTGKSTLLNGGDTNASDQTVRLAADRNGILWSIGGTGKLWRMDPDAATPRWRHVGNVTLPSGHNLTGWGNDTSSGDIAFDGNGTLYLIASNQDTNISYLLTISPGEMAKAVPGASPTPSIKSTWVGQMGPAPFMYNNIKMTYNGIAFDSDGVLYASAGDPNSYRAVISKVNISTGNTYGHVAVNNARLSDLSSCALPQPRLEVTKVPVEERIIHEGEQITWTILVKNVGTLAATNVRFVDVINDADSTRISSKLNGVVNSSTGDPNGKDWYQTERLINSPGSLAGNIEPGKTAKIEITVEVPNNFIANQQETNPELRLCNQGTVTYTGGTAILSGDPDNPGSFDKTCVTVSNPEIDMIKSAPCLPDHDVTTEHEVKFTMKVTNPGTESLWDVEVSDPACDANTLTKVSAADMGDTEAAAKDNGDVLLDPGETWYYQCSLTTGEAIENEATVNSKTVLTPQTNPNSRPSKKAKAVVELPGLSMTKTATTATGDQIVSPGEIVTYTLTIRNDGPDQIDQKGISLIDDLPEGLTYEAGTTTRTFYHQYPGEERKQHTETVDTPMNADRQLELITYLQPASGETNDGLSLKPYATSGEEITVTFQAKVDKTIDLTSITSLTNTAVTTPEVTALQCPVRASVNNELTAKYQFTVKKQSSNCDVGQTECGLEGAEFALYGEATPATVPPSMASTPITNGIKADSVTEGLNSSTFTSAELRAGRYWLVETKSPAGFNLLAEPIEFVLSVDTNGVPVVTLADPSTHGNIVTITAGKKDSSTGAITPPQIAINDTTPGPLPLTGGPGVMQYLLWGCGLTLGGGLLGLRRKTSGLLATSGVKK